MHKTNHNKASCLPCALGHCSTVILSGWATDWLSALLEGNVVWLDEVTATRALINMSSMPEEEKMKPQENSKKVAVVEASKKGRCFWKLTFPWSLGRESLSSGL